MNTKEYFSRRIKGLRIGEGLTQEELVARIGISRSAYVHYERGKRLPDIDIMNKIADYFQVTKDYLTGLTDEPQNSVAEEISNKALREIAKTARKSTSVFYSLTQALIQLGTMDFGADKTEFLYSILANIFSNLEQMLSELKTIHDNLEELSEDYKSISPIHESFSDDRIALEVTRGGISGYVQNCLMDLIRIMDVFTVNGTLK